MRYHSPSLFITRQHFLTKPKTSITLELENRSQKNPENARNNYSASVPGKPASTMSSWEALFKKPRRSARRLNEILDIFQFKTFIVLLSSFSLCLLHLPDTTVTRHAFKFPERTLTSKTFEPYPLQPRKEKRTTRFSTVLKRKASKNPISVQEIGYRTPTLVPKKYVVR